jgi:hypothetical protein
MRFLIVNEKEENARVNMHKLPFINNKFREIVTTVRGLLKMRGGL